MSDHLYLYAESLIQIEMYNDSVHIPFLKTKKYVLLYPRIPEKYEFFVLRRVSSLFNTFI
jgi:hypothetical protein